MFSRILLVAAMAVGAAACVGDPDTGSGDPGTNPNPNPNGDNSTGAQAAKKAFEDTVYPIVSTTCGGCHGAANISPVFVGPSKAESYNYAVGYQQVVGSWTNDTAGIYKVPMIAAHASVAPYTADQQKAIGDWLALEAAARAGGTPTTPGSGEETPGAAASRLTKAFQSCMATADFTASQLANRMSNQGSGEGACRVCHVNGQGGMIANELAPATEGSMYSTLKTNGYFLSMFYTANVAVKPYKMAFNEQAFVRVATRKFPHQDHPTFSTTGNNAQGITAAKDFLTRTLARLDANGNCPTPQQ